MRLHLVERAGGPARLAVPPHEVARRLEVVGLAEEEDDLPVLPGVEVEFHLEGGAGVQDGPHAAGELDPPQGGGGRHRAQAAEELGAVGRERPRPPVDVDERHPRGEVRPEGVPGQQGAGLGVELGDDVHRGGIAVRPQHPLDVEGRREPTAPVARVGDPQPDHLDRVVGRDEQDQLVGEAVGVPFKDRVTLAVTDERGRSRRDGQGRRAPDLAGLLVAQIDDLAGGVGDRVVAPGRQAILLAVAGPGEARSGLGDLEAERGVGDDVDPGRGRQERPGRGRSRG